MSSKKLDDRWRYIAFKIEGNKKFERNDFLRALISASRETRFANSFRITVFEGDFAILKVPHTLKEEAINVLRSIDTVKGDGCKVITLKTSGTIRTLKEKYRHLIADSKDVTE